MRYDACTTTLATMNSQTTGGRIKALREARGLTQAQLGAAIGTTQNVVSKWENDHVAPDTPFIVPLADALHTTADHILRSDGDLPRGLAEAVAMAASVLGTPISEAELVWCRMEVRSHGDVSPLEWMSRIAGRRRGLSPQQVAREVEATAAAEAKAKAAGVRRRKLR